MLLVITPLYMLAQTFLKAALNIMNTVESCFCHCSECAEAVLWTKTLDKHQPVGNGPCNDYF